MVQSLQEEGPGALHAYDVSRLKDGGELLVGVDEAGRGALAGPVVAAAVALPPRFYKSRWCRKHACEVNDSKQLGAERRAVLCQHLLDLHGQGFLRAAVGEATVEEIASHNILGATRLAMLRALDALQRPMANVFDQRFLARLSLDYAGATPPRPVRSFAVRLRAPCEDSGELFATVEEAPPPLLLIDGRALKKFPYVHEGLVGGDGRSLAIALASILAKVSRDKLMAHLHRTYPHYGFAAHKGYGTARHCACLREHGPCPHHREGFLRRILAEEDAGERA